MSGEAGGTELTHKNLAKKSHERLISLGDRDPLTGIGNVRALEKWFHEDEVRQTNEKVRKEERRETGNSYPMYGVAIFLDADGLGKANFKGHGHGDSLLKSIVSAGSEIAHRPLDVIFRRGENSDEFILFLPGALEHNFEVLNKSFNESIKRISGNEDFSASLAFGVYGYGRTARETVKLLDGKLSEAKAGRPKGEHIQTIFYKE